MEDQAPKPLRLHQMGPTSGNTTYFFKIWIDVVFEILKHIYVSVPWYLTMHDLPTQGLL